MNTIITLTPLHMSLAAAMIVILAILSFLLKLGIQWKIVISALRTTIQLLLIGLVLKIIFNNLNILYIAIMATVMLLVAGREVMARQKHRFTGIWGYALGTGSMLISSFTVTIFSLITVIGVKPWYEPRYAIPLLGMVLGNTMNGIALGLDKVTQSASEQQKIIEQKLMLGYSSSEAFADIRSDSMRTAMIPILNSMAAAGIVSLPGMMTGQILGGNPPMEAVKYQILIMFMIAAGTGFGSVCAILVASKRLFDHRHRLRIDRLN